LQQAIVQLSFVFFSNNGFSSIFRTLVRFSFKLSLEQLREYQTADQFQVFFLPLLTAVKAAFKWSGLQEALNLLSSG
jgi:hypothetical protein